MLPGDGVVLEGFHQRQRHGQRDGGDQRHPQPGQPGRGDRQGQHQPVREPGLGGVFLHHSGVAEHLAAADVEGAVDRALQRRRRHEVVQHVPDGDRLDLVRTQLGAGISGRVSDRCRIISNDAEPEPITTPAWKTTASTGLSRKTLPTASRERMWVDSSAPAGCRPPR